MSRALGIDYGLKRTGLAVTDPLRIIATPLETVETPKLEDFLMAYLAKEAVDDIVIGEPLHSDGTPTNLHPKVIYLYNFLKNKYPNLAVHLHDEAFSSSEAKSLILQSGIGKMKRRDKSLVDKISAWIILRDFLKLY